MDLTRYLGRHGMYMVIRVCWVPMQEFIRIIWGYMGLGFRVIWGYVKATSYGCQKLEALLWEAP